jgi:solute:Na+ symporter, SSS family
MVVAAIWAPMIQNFPGLFSYIQSMFAYIVSPVVGVFLVGFFWERANGQGAFVTLVTSHIIAAITFGLVQGEIIEIHFLYVASLLFLLSCVLLWFFSQQIGTPPTHEQTYQLTFSSGYAEPDIDDPAWYADFRYQAAVVVALTVLTLITFW